MVTVEHIPDDLRRLPRWVLWQYETRGDDKKPTKVPYQISGAKARSDDPTTWVEFDRVFACVGKYSGIGVMLGDGLAGVDLDNCIDEDGKLKPWASSVIKALASYAEISPSQLGVKVFLFGDLPPGGNRIKVQDGEIEMYSRGRYFTVTGEHLEGTPTEVAHRQAQLEAVHARLFEAKADPEPQAAARRTERPTGLADSELLEKARTAKDGAKFRDLWDGGGGEDASAADLALVGKLAFWTGGDAGRMDQLFRQSRRMREKWDERHYSDGRTYGQGTIEKALSEATEFYTPGGGQGADWKAEVAESIEHLVNTAEGAPPPGQEDIAAAAERLVEEVTESKDTDAVWKAVPILASLDRTEYGRIKSKLKSLLREVLNLPDLEAAVKEARKRSREPGGPGEENLPLVMVGGQLRDVVRDALAALKTANDPPSIFVRSGELVGITRDEYERAVIGRLSTDALRGKLTHAANFVRTFKDGQRHCSPPDEVTRTLGAQGEWPFPALEAVVEHPVMRPDGTVLATRGYDPVTRFYYAPQTNQTLPPISNKPTDEEIQRAVETIVKPISEFPFADGASMANTIAMFMTPLARPAIRGPVPCAVINAHVQGSGKTLLADIGAVVATGRSAGMITAPTTDEEWQKMILAMVVQGAASVVIDNVERTVGNGPLSAALTADTIEGRILGYTEMGRYPHRAMWVMTGNNVGLKGEMPRRCYWISLDPKVVRPWQREDFSIGDLRGWVRAHRSELCAALLTLLRAWFEAGQPEPDIPRMGSFEEWQRVIGGALAHVGIDGFLGNIETMYDMADADSLAWEAFLTAWQQTTTVSVTSKRLASLCTDNAHLMETVPDWMIDAKGVNTRKLGKALSTKQGARFGDRGVRIERDGVERRAVKWIVKSEVPCDPLEGASGDLFA